MARELQWKETASASSSSSDERMVGCATIPKNLMLVNLDGDNLPGQLFIISLLRESATKMEDNTFCLWHYLKRLQPRWHMRPHHHVVGCATTVVGCATTEKSEE